jgi:hypothetical protein
MYSKKMTQNEFLPEQVLIPFFGDKPIVGVEIGVLGASGSVAMLNRMPNLKLYAVDPWLHFDGHEYEAENPQEYHDLNYEAAVKRLAEYGDRVQIMKMTSDEFYGIISELVDFIHIDGSHQYEQVKRDINNAKKHIKPTAIISGHDWWLPHIQQAVHEELGEVETGEDGLWIKNYLPL